MLKQEALDLLKQGNRSNSPSKVNPSFTCRQVTEIIEKMVNGLRDDWDSKKTWMYRTGDLIEKRVWQAIKNQRRPKY